MFSCFKKNSESSIQLCTVKIFKIKISEPWKPYKPMKSARKSEWYWKALEAMTMKLEILGNQKA